MTAHGGRAVVAIGGNAIAPRGTPATAAAQESAVRAPMQAMARAIHEGLDIVLIHGNGPQVGNLLLRGDLCADVLTPLPVGWAVAQTQATIGMILATALQEALAELGHSMPVVPLITRVLVEDAEGDAVKAVGQPVGDPTLHARLTALGTTTPGRWRRTADGRLQRHIASPRPVAILDEAPIRILLDAGAVVIAGGGGGVPVRHLADGRTRDVEGVADKDLTAVLLALAVDADQLVLLTDAPAVGVHFGTDQERWLSHTTVEELDALSAAGHFPHGSMGPKVRAATWYVRSGGGRAVIGALSDADAVLRGQAGTQINA
jgi:carbamate kinase